MIELGAQAEQASLASPHSTFHLLQSMATIEIMHKINKHAQFYMRSVGKRENQRPKETQPAVPDDPTLARQRILPQNLIPTLALCLLKEVNTIGCRSLVSVGGVG